MTGVHVSGRETRVRWASRTSTGSLVYRTTTGMHATRRAGRETTHSDTTHAPTTETKYAFLGGPDCTVRNVRLQYFLCLFVYLDYSFPSPFIWLTIPEKWSNACSPRDHRNQSRWTHLKAAEVKWESPLIVFPDDEIEFCTHICLKKARSLTRFLCLLNTHKKNLLQVLCTIMLQQQRCRFRPYVSFTHPFYP